jgi:hypothetical protein
VSRRSGTLCTRVIEGPRRRGPDRAQRAGHRVPGLVLTSSVRCAHDRGRRAGPNAGVSDVSRRRVAGPSKNQSKDQASSRLIMVVIVTKVTTPGDGWCVSWKADKPGVVGSSPAAPTLVHPCSPSSEVRTRVLKKQGSSRVDRAARAAVLMCSGCDSMRRRAMRRAPG